MIVREKISTGPVPAGAGDHPGCAARLPAMQTWEYATVPLLIHATKAILDQWGADGWELVQVIQGPDAGLVAYLKRPTGER